MPQEPVDRDAPPPKPENGDINAAARRRLLKLALYTAPVILGTFTISGNAVGASCPPGACNPSGGPCGPNPCLPAPCGPSLCKPNN